MLTDVASILILLLLPGSAPSVIFGCPEGTADSRGPRTNTHPQVVDRDRIELQAIRNIWIYQTGGVFSHPLYSSFNESYRGSPPWDIGRPQTEFVSLARNGEIRGRVLDVGCGTGENAIFFSRFGKEVWGIDSAPLAIEKAKLKAQERGASVRFLVADAFRLDRLGTRFDTITDCGLFHTFSNEQRSLFTKSLRSAMEKQGTYFMLAFSTKEPTDWGGPRRLSEEEILDVFGRGWKINYVKESKIETNFHPEGGKGLISSITVG